MSTNQSSKPYWKKCSSAARQPSLMVRKEWREGTPITHYLSTDGMCVSVCVSFAAKKYAELFGKEKKEKKAKEPKKAAEASPKKEKKEKEKKPVVKEEEEEEEEEEAPKPPAFKDPYLELPKRCVCVCT